MKVQLGIIERATLLQTLPEIGDFVTLKTIRKLREKVALSEDEVKKFGLVYDFSCPTCGATIKSLIPVDCPVCKKKMQMIGSVSWNADVNTLTELDFNDLEENIIKTALKGLNESKKLTDRHFTLYTKFIGE